MNRTLLVDPGAARGSIRSALPSLLLLGLAACGGSGGGGSDLSGGGGGGGSTANSVPIVIDSGPTATAPVQNLGYVTVTLCVPGTSTCQTIDHVQIDTGSIGFRVLNAALAGGANGITASQLPAIDASDGNPLAECVQYVDGYTFGSVRKADLKIAGEVASGIGIQIIGDLENSIPAACADDGGAPEEDTILSFGANAILGVQQFLEDWGPDAPVDGTAYSSCTTAARPVCTPIAVAQSAQVPNPVGKFAADNNGVVIAFPTADCNPASSSISQTTGANPTTNGASCAGTLYFGIGTQTDNALPSTALVYTIDPTFTDLTFASLNVTFAPSGGLLPYSYIDAGTSSLYFPDNGNATPHLCTDAAGSGFYCPTSLLAETAEVQGFSNGSESTLSFSVGNADAIFAAAVTGETTGAFQPFIVGDSGNGSDSFVLGLPFFYGRTIYVGFEGSSFAGVAGPVYAF